MEILFVTVNPASFANKFQLSLQDCVFILMEIYVRKLENYEDYFNNTKILASAKATHT